MNPDWQSFISAQLPSAPAAADIAHPLSELEGCLLIPLQHQGLLQVQGPDSAKFMQGQFTCDLNQVSPQRSQLGAVCTPQGRMYSSFRVFQTATDNPTYWLRMRQGVIESTLATLSKYSVFFKTDMTDLSENHVGIGLLGPTAQALLEQHFDISLGQSPSDVVIPLATGLLAQAPCVNEGLSRWECWLPVAEAIQLCQQLSAHCEIAPYSQWLLADIDAGLAEIDSSEIETFVPHMLNYQATGAISFDKGCYTGQEIVARTQYRGKAKRALYRVALIGHERPEAGQDILVEDTTHIGVIISAISTATDQHQALAVMSKDAAKNASKVLIVNNFYKLIIENLPYPV